MKAERWRRMGKLGGWVGGKLKGWMERLKEGREDGWMGGRPWGGWWLAEDSLLLMAGCVSGRPRELPGAVRHHADRGGNAAPVPGTGGRAAHAPGQYRCLEDHQPLPQRRRYVGAFQSSPGETWVGWVPGANTRPKREPLNEVGRQPRRSCHRLWAERGWFPTPGAAGKGGATPLWNQDHIASLFQLSVCWSVKETQLPTMELCSVS